MEKEINTNEYNYIVGFFLKSDKLKEIFHFVFVISLYNIEKEIELFKKEIVENFIDKKCGDSITVNDIDFCIMDNIVKNLNKGE